MANIHAVLSTIGYGLIIFALLLCGMCGCGGSAKKEGCSFWGTFGWLCAVSGFLLQIISLWIA